MSPTIPEYCLGTVACHITVLVLYSCIHSTLPDIMEHKRYFKLTNPSDISSTREENNIAVINFIEIL